MTRRTGVGRPVPIADAPTVSHLLTLLSATVVMYAFVTRGALVVANGLALLARRR